MKRTWLAFTVVLLSLPVCSRADNLQFSNVTSGVSVPLNAITVGNDSTFVAVGSSSTTLGSSLGGSPWTSNSVGVAGQNLTAVTYGSGILLAGGASGNIFSSGNGA